MNNSNKLVEIKPSEWKKLRDLYTSNWPLDIIGYFTVDNFIRWYEKDPNVKNLKFYSLNDDWSDGTFICLVKYN